MPSRNGEPTYLTVRELIGELLKHEMDSDVTLSVYNSDPVPCNAVDEDGEQVVLSLQQAATKPEIPGA